MAKQAPKNQSDQDRLGFKKKRLGYRTPDRFKRQTFRKKPDVTFRPRSLGGHR